MVLSFASVGEAVARSLSAGVDLFLACHSQETQDLVIESIVQAVKSGTVPLKSVLESCERVDALLNKYALRPQRSATLKIIGSQGKPAKAISMSQPLILTLANLSQRTEISSNQFCPLLQSTPSPDESRMVVDMERRDLCQHLRQLFL